MKIKKQVITKKKLIIASAAIVVAGIGGAVAMASQPHQATKTAAVNATVQTATTPDTTVQPTTTDTTDTTAPMTQPVAAPATDTTTTSPAPAPAPVAPTYQFAVAMANAGIAQSDFGYVTDMVLDSNGWRLTGPNLWQHANANNDGYNESITWNLGRVNYYVTATYGSWSAADAQWVSTGDF